MCFKALVLGNSLSNCPKVTQKLDNALCLYLYKSHDVS